MKVFEAGSTKFKSVNDIFNFVKDNPFTWVYKVLHQKDTGEYNLRYFGDAKFDSKEHFALDITIKNIIDSYSNAIETIDTKNGKKSKIDELTKLINCHVLELYP